MAYIKDPKSIEARSFEIITETIVDKIYKFIESENLILKRIFNNKRDFYYD